jgi:hypothetical protein
MYMYMHTIKKIVPYCHKCHFSSQQHKDDDYTNSYGWNAYHV